MSEPSTSATPVEGGGSPRSGRRFDAGKEPYVGPRPFEPEHKSVFFGREREAVNLMHRILAHDEILIHSPSGAGKTSLINACLIPLLEEQGCEVLPVARVNGPSINTYDLKIPNIFVFHTLRCWSKDGTASGSDLLTVPNIKQFLCNLPKSVVERSAPRVIIFDQFEELFTVHPERSNERKEFFEQLQEAMSCDPLLRVVFSMREDYLAELKPYGLLLPEKLRSTFQLNRLGPEAALDAITKPLQQTQNGFAPGAAEKLIENLQNAAPGGHIEAMQLQVVCQSLWCERDPQDSEITIKDVEKYADVNSALARYYENAIRQILQRGGSSSSVSEGKLRRWFEENLITPAGTRGTVFRGAFETGGMPNEIIDELVFRNLIRCEERANANWFELAHDRFIKPIKDSNHLWLSKRAGVEETRQRLENAAKAWIEHNRDDDYLLDLAELTEAQRWVKNLQAAELETSDAVHTLVQASQSAIRARNVNRLQRWVAALAAASILAVMFAGIAWWNERRATYQLARNYVDSGVRLLEADDPSGAFLWFLCAQREGLNEPSELQNLRLGSVARQLPWISKYWVLGETDAYRGHGAVTMAGAEFSADGKFVISATGDPGGQRGSGVIWPTEGIGTPIFLPHQDGKVTFASFSPDGNFAVTASTGPQGSKGQARLWRFKGLGQEPELLKELQHDHPVVCAAFNPDSNLLVTAGGEPEDESTECFVLDVATLEDPKKLPHKGMVSHVVFNKRGDLFVTSSRSSSRNLSATTTQQLSKSDLGEARIYDPHRKEVDPLCTILHDSPVHHAAFSPDSSWLATGSGEIGSGTGYVSLWEVGDKEKFAELVRRSRDNKTVNPIYKLKQDGPVAHVEFNPDSNLIASASYDSTARIWDWKKNRERILRHESSVFWTTFSPDGRRVATTSRDWTARVWDAYTGHPIIPPLRHNGTVSRAYFDSHGRQLLTAAKDTARMWDLATNTRQFKAQTIDPADAVSCNATGEFVVTTGGPAGFGPRYAHIRSSSLVRPIPLRHDGFLQKMFFSQNDKCILTVSANETVANKLTNEATAITVWSRSGERLSQLQSELHHVNSLALSYDQRYVVAGAGGVTAQSGQVAVWDLQASPPHETLLPPKHNGGVLFVAFSPSQSNLMVSASADDRACVWEIGANGNAAPRKWNGSVELRHTADVTFAAFSDGNQYLVTTSQDCHAKVWDLTTGEQMAALRHPTPVRFAAFSPIVTNSKLLLVTGGTDGGIRVWDVTTQELVAYLKSEGVLQSVGFTYPHGVVSGIEAVSRISQPDQPTSEAQIQIAISHWDLDWKARGIDLQYGQLSAVRELRDDSRQLTAIEDSKKLFGYWSTVKDEFRPVQLAEEEWHKQAVDDAEFFNHWTAVIWHLDILTKLTKDPIKRSEYLARRAGIYAKTLDFKQALDDYNNALGDASVPVVEQCEWLRLKAEAHAERKEWDEAMESLRKAQFIDKKDPRVISFLAILHLRNGNLPAYQAIGKAFENFSPDNDRFALNYTWLCMLGPGFSPDLNEARELADGFEKRYPKARRFLTTTGAILYRQGKYEEAIEKLMKSRSVYEEEQRSRNEPADVRRTEDGVIWDNLLLAMAHHWLKHPDEARQCWDKAHAWYVDFKDDKITLGPRLPWTFRVAIDLLHREAEELIQPKSP